MRKQMVPNHAGMYLHVHEGPDLLQMSEMIRYLHERSDEIERRLGVPCL